MTEMTKKLEKLCIKWLNDNYNPMEQFIMKEYPDYIFHMKNGQCILQYNKKSGYVYVNYREIWSFFEGVFSMSNRQIKDVTKIWVEEHYKMKETSTNIIFPHTIRSVEEHYKMGVTTIVIDQRGISPLVEEHYQEITTSSPTPFSPINILIEEQYKEIKTSYFDPPYNPESVMDSEITNQPITDWPFNENLVNELYEQETDG